MPDSNDNGKMPVLDLEVWVQDNKIRHNFFKKAVSSEFTIMSRSKISDSMKLNTLFMECYRRLINCDQDTPWGVIASHLSQYSNTLRISGYTELQRYNAIKGVIA